MINLEINGHNLAVLDQGPPGGKTVVLLHHGLGAIPAWSAQIPALLEAGYRVVAYDRWGYGGSQARQGLALPGFEPDRADLLDLVSALEIGRFALVGHSDGGTIALYFAADHPAMVACLVTIAAHIYVEPMMEGGIRGVFDAFENDPRFRKGLRRYHGENTNQVFANWYYGWCSPENQDWDMRPHLAGIRCPLLVVQGQEDEHATPEHALDIAAGVPGASVWLVPEADHMLQQRNAEQLNPRLINFLDANWSPE